MANLFGNDDLMRRIMGNMGTGESFNRALMTNNNFSTAAKQAHDQQVLVARANAFAESIPLLLRGSKYDEISAGIENFLTMEQAQQTIFRTLDTETNIHNPSPFGPQYLLDTDRRALLFKVMSRHATNEGLVASICNMLERVYDMAAFVQRDHNEETLWYGTRLFEVLDNMSRCESTVETVLRVYQGMIQNNNTTMSILHGRPMGRDYVAGIFHILIRYGVQNPHHPNVDIIKMCVAMILPIYGGYILQGTMPPPIETLTSIIEIDNLDLDCQVGCCRLIGLTEVRWDLFQKCVERVAHILGNSYSSVPNVTIDKFLDSHLAVLETLKNILKEKKVLKTDGLLSSNRFMASLLGTLTGFQVRGDAIDLHLSKNDKSQIMVDCACEVLLVILENCQSTPHPEYLKQMGILEVLVHTIDCRKNDADILRENFALVSAWKGLHIILGFIRSFAPTADIICDPSRIHGVSAQLQGLPLCQFVYNFYNTYRWSNHMNSRLVFSIIMEEAASVLYQFFENKASTDTALHYIPNFSIPDLLYATNNLFQQNTVIPITSRDEHEMYESIAHHMDGVLENLILFHEQRFQDERVAVPLTIYLGQSNYRTRNPARLTDLINAHR